MKYHKPSPLLLLLFVIITCYFLLEVLISFFGITKYYYATEFNETLGFKYKPNLNMAQKSIEYQVIFKTNAKGYRDTNKEKHLPNFVFLGDSFTVGYGVEENQTFVSLLENTSNLSILNMAVGGYEPLHVYQQIKYVLNNTSTKNIVYVTYLGNDIVNINEWYVDYNNQLIPYKDIQLSVFQDKFGLGVFEIMNKVWQSYKYKRLVQYHHGLWKPPKSYLDLINKTQNMETKMAYDKYFLTLQKIQTEVKNQNKSLLVILIPTSVSVTSQVQSNLRTEVPGFDTQYDVLQPTTKTIVFLQSNNFTYIDTTKQLIFYQSKTNDSLYYSIDAHLTDTGHKIVAEIIQNNIEWQKKTNLTLVVEK